MSDLPKGWVETTLGEVIEICSGKTRPKQQGAYPVYGGNGILNYGDKFNQEGETIIVGRVGAYCGNVFYENQPFWLSDNALGVKAKEISYEKFLYYKLVSMKLNNHAIGGAQPLLTQILLKELEINLPPLHEQKAIADMLSSFDEKIELLREQNKTLETLAQTIFKEWFVHFNYPDATGAMVDSELGEIPKGWRVGSLLEVFDLIGGGTPKTSVDEYWNGGIHWYSVVDAPKGSETFVIETEKNISALGLSKSSTKLLQKGATIVSARGTVGKLALVGCETAMNQSCYGIKGKGCFGDYYVYFQLKEALNSLKSRVHGAVFDTITQSTFKNIMVALPDNEVVTKYEERVTPILERILNNVFQVQSLSKTRDTLLPKLMSGQVRIN